MEPQETIVSTEPDLREIIARDLTQEAADILSNLNRVLERLHILFGDNRLGHSPIPPPRPAETPVETRWSGTAAAPVNAAAISCLTSRERDVLGLLIQGLSNRRIARMLQISEPTVKNHLHAIFLKLQVTDRTQAMAKVLGTSQHGRDALRQGGGN